MSLEIERKYLVTGTDWRVPGTGTDFRQGYLSTVPERSVRVRIAGERGYLTIKGATTGAVRAEYEYTIPARDAREMLDNLCERPLIEKTRYRIAYRGGVVWEVDEFHGRNAGLVLAEVELDAEDQTFELPAWVGREVTGDPRYYNAYLTLHPFDSWQRKDDPSL